MLALFQPYRSSLFIQGRVQRCGSPFLRYLSPHYGLHSLLVTGVIPSQSCRSWLSQPAPAYSCDFLSCHKRRHSCRDRCLLVSAAIGLLLLSISPSPTITPAVAPKISCLLSMVALVPYWDQIVPLPHKPWPYHSRTFMPSFTLESVEPSSRDLMKVFKKLIGLEELFELHMVTSRLAIDDPSRL